MAKTIKFNLILDGNPVRNIDDLKNNFSIEDILDIFNKGLLQKWLSVRDYNEYLDKVNSIEVDNNINQIKELIKIFGVECDDRKIKEDLAILDYINERKIIFDEYRKASYDNKKIIEDYHAGYDAIIIDIIENKDNMPKIKANIKEIEENYMGLFDLNYRDLFYNLINNAPLAVFAILMNGKMRSYFIEGENASENTKQIYIKLKDFMASKAVLKEKLGEELKVFKGNTAAYWKDIEPQGKIFMIISMESGNFVRNSAISGEELSNIEVNYAFLLLNGIDYKSNYETQELLYMEV